MKTIERISRVEECSNLVYLDFKRDFLSPIDWTRTSEMVIAGGFARWVAMEGLTYNFSDIDLFPCDEYSYNNLVFNYDELIKRGKLFFNRENEMCIDYTISDSNSILHKRKIQLIKPPNEKIKRAVSMGDTKEIISQFDFSICRVGINSLTDEIFIDDDFLKDEKLKTLRIVNSHCPINTLCRAIKYINKGYRFYAHRMIDLFIDWDSRDQEYRNTLQKMLKRVEDFIENKGEKLSKEEFWQMEELLRID